MPVDKLHLRHCILFQFQRGLKAAKAYEEQVEVFGEDAMGRSTCYEWYTKFKAGNFDLEDEERTGKPKEITAAQIQELLDEDPRQSTRELADQLGCSNSTVYERLREMGKIQKSTHWVPHELSVANKANRLSIASSLRAKFDANNFLWKVVTGDEKWIFLTNPDTKKAWTSVGEPAPKVAKKNQFGKKVMLCVWWDIGGILYYELLQPSQTVNAQRYSEQLTRLNTAIVEKRPWNRRGKRPVTLLHDNARPHVAKLTQQKIQELGWKVLPHPAYSPDLAPSDFHLFRSMEHQLRGEVFKNFNEVRSFVDEFFRSKDVLFYRDGIYGLPNRWSRVIEKDGDYFE
jgi:histone-lysine N-methyltransferase SETMAR